LQGKYRVWAKEAKFESKLPSDAKKRKVAAEHLTWTLDQDLREKSLLERIVPYSDKIFCRSASEWLIATDQPIQALEHPKFREMIEIASCATSGVKMPGRKGTRTEIKRMFLDHITNLKAQLDVSPGHLFCCLFSKTRLRDQPSWVK